MKFSVIIPAYNAEPYLTKAIESCFCQTYAPHEIIVVDDGSTDGTAKLAESFPPPARLVRLPQNMGLPSARNRGAEVASGDWLVFLDADDWFLPKKLERQRLCALQNENAMLIYTGFFLSLNGVESPGRFNPPTVLEPMLRYKCAFHVGTVALRRDAFDSLGGFDPALRVSEDWDLWLRIAARYSIKVFAGISEPLAVYRVTPGSLSSNSMRMYEARYGLLEKRCLYGMTGMLRRSWRRKVNAFLHYDASIALREEGSTLDLPFIFKSIAAWPFPWSEMPKRYKTAAVMVKQHLFKRLSRLAIRA